MELRRADLAGSWYPGNESDCRKAIKDYETASLACPCEAGDTIGGIVPHAGWVYSGRIACNVIKCISPPSEPDTCIVFGRHLHPGSGNYIMKQGYWATPIGNLEIDSGVADKLTSEFRFVIETASYYEQDNTIEVQLPFIKYFFPSIKIVPLGLPPKKSSLQIARRAAEIAIEMGRKTIVLGSTDLTHYGPNYGNTLKGTGEQAVRWVKEENDKRAVDLMTAMDEEGVIVESLENQNACCGGAVGAAIVAAKELGAKRGEKIVYSTSYDVRPDSSFVGYVGVVFCQ